jgi:hypothetical protein
LCRIVETKKSFLLAWLNVAADPRISQKALQANEKALRHTRRRARF